MAAVVNLHSLSDDNWPPRKADGSMPSWVSEGSRAHQAKQCKPCAFFHAQGCQSGSACKFCHLCPPREVQRRKRLRRRLAREQVAREQGWFGSFRERITSSISRQAEAASSACSIAGIPLGSIGPPDTPATQPQGSTREATLLVPTSALGSLGSMVLGSIVPMGLMQPMIPGISMAASSVMQLTTDLTSTNPSRTAEPAAALAASSHPRNREMDSAPLQASLPRLPSDDEPGSPSPFRCVSVMDFPQVPAVPTVEAPNQVLDSDESIPQPPSLDQGHTHYVYVPVPVPMPVIQQLHQAQEFQSPCLVEHDYSQIVESDRHDYCTMQRLVPS